MAVRLTVLKIGRGKRSDRSGYNEIDYNSLNVQFRTTYCIVSETLNLVQSELGIGDDLASVMFFRSFSQLRNSPFRRSAFSEHTSFASL